MKSRISVCSVAVFLILSVAAIANVAKAQDSAAATNARKVRTKTSPEYPTLARQLNVTGKVKLEVTIAADGHVVSTRTIGGSPLLVGPAADAVKKWRYEPGPKETTEIVEIAFAEKN
jgi:TonB family protein